MFGVTIDRRKLMALTAMALVAGCTVVPKPRLAWATPWRRWMRCCPAAKSPWRAN